MKYIDKIDWILVLVYYTVFAIIIVGFGWVTSVPTLILSIVITSLLLITMLRMKTLDDRRVVKRINRVNKLIK